MSGYQQVGFLIAVQQANEQYQRLFVFGPGNRFAALVHNVLRKKNIDAVLNQSYRGLRDFFFYIISGFFEIIALIGNGLACRSGRSLFAVFGRMAGAKDQSQKKKESSRFFPM